LLAWKGLKFFIDKSPTCVCRIRQHFKVHATREGIDGANQGDQIERILAHWVIVCFDHFFGNYKSIPHFEPLLSTVKAKH
jgi:hypothetical protein